MRLAVPRDGLRMACIERHSRRVARVLRLAACLVAEGFLGATMASLGAQNPAGRWDPNAADTTAIGLIGGTLVDAGDGQPMSYATATLVGTERASFADPQGHFRFARLRFDTYHLRARQIGYAPLDTTIVLTGNAPDVDVTLRMHRVAVRLPAVAVLGSRARGCVAPGVPDSAVDPALAGIFAEVRENVDRFRILLEAYPFRFRRLEIVVLRSDPGGDSTLSVDTATYESRARHPYRVGHVVYVDKDAHGRPVRLMYLPTFRDLADSSFLGMHCFHYAGTEDLGPTHSLPALRIDFRPADSIRTPDVAGSIYLDSASLVIRRAVFQLANAQALHLSVLGLTVTTTYREIAALVPMIDSVITDEPLVPVRKSVRAAEPGGALLRPTLVRRTAIEQSSLVGYAFEQRIPGEAEPHERLRGPQTAAAGDAGPTGGALVDTAPTALALAGRVRDASGAAVSAAIVALIGTHDTTVTDDSGRFVLHGPRSGAYVLSVRRLGFERHRLAVSISSERAGRVTVSLIRTVPVLPTVTTTAAERRGYRDVGFDDRMRGLGYFLTYDQIVRKQATAFGDLIKDIPGIEAVHTPDGWMITSKRSGCVSYMLDGMPLSVVRPVMVAGKPLNQLGPGTPVGTALVPDSPDNYIDANAPGAIEYYEPSERPAQFGSGRCATVVVWTRTRLRLPVGAQALPDTAANDAPVVRGVPSLESDAVCAVPASADTTDLPIYAILAGVPSRAVAKNVWAAYTDSVLSVIDHWSVLPTDLRLPTFGRVVTTNSSGGERHARATVGEVAPTVSSVFVFSLDSSGALAGTRVAASALSGAADTAMLAGLERAADANAFPRFPGSPSGRDSIRFDLLLTSVEPAVGTKAAVVGRLEVPVWPLAREARQLAETTLYPRDADSATVQMVVDAEGRAINGTVRVLQGPANVDLNSPDSDYRQRLAQRLNQLRFEPAQIGSCSVPQLVTQVVVVPARAIESR